MVAAAGGVKVVIVAMQVHVASAAVQEYAGSHWHANTRAHTRAQSHAHTRARAHAHARTRRYGCLALARLAFNEDNRVEVAECAPRAPVPWPVAAHASNRDWRLDH